MKLRHTISLVSSERDEGSKVWQPFFYGKVWQLWQKCREGGGSVFSEVLRRRGNICHNETHTQVRKDLIEHIWQKFGN